MTPETPKQMSSVAVSTPAATRTILIVDDDPSVTETFERMLRLEGYHVVTALSAEAGLPQARQKALLGARAAPHLPQLGAAFIAAVGSASSSRAGAAGSSYLAPHERQNAALAASCSPHCEQERSPPSGACASPSVIPTR